MIKNLKNSFGVTFIELSVSIALISILAAYTAPDYSNIIREAKAVTCQIQRKALENAEMLYLIEHNYQNSASIEELLQEGYIDTIPECQDRGKYYWKSISPRPELGCTIHASRDSK